MRYGVQPFIRTVASLSRSYKEGTSSANDEGDTATGDSCRGIGGQQLVSRAIGGRKFLECGFKVSYLYIHVKIMLWFILCICTVYDTCYLERSDAEELV